MIWLLSNRGEHNIAIRISEVESLETAKNMAGKINWAWVDCFSKIPIGKKEYDELKDLGYKLCFVSPELEGREHDIVMNRQCLSCRIAEIGLLCKELSAWKTERNTVAETVDLTVYCRKLVCNQ